MGYKGYILGYVDRTSSVTINPKDNIRSSPFGSLGNVSLSARRRGAWGRSFPSTPRAARRTRGVNLHAESPTRRPRPVHVRHDGEPGLLGLVSYCVLLRFRSTLRDAPVPSGGLPFRHQRTQNSLRFLERTTVSRLKGDDPTTPPPRGLPLSLSLSLCLIHRYSGLCGLSLAHSWRAGRGDHRRTRVSRDSSTGPRHLPRAPSRPDLPRPSDMDAPDAEGVMDDVTAKGVSGGRGMPELRQTPPF